MSEVPNLPAQTAACGSTNGRAPAKSQSSASPGAETPLAFRALIERLRDQARALEQSTAQPMDARDLSGAVQAAQASLHDALSIADGLVEAYRSNRIQSGGSPAERAR